MEATRPHDAGRRVRPTIRDVAALAGVSTKTVSRVLNGEPRVSPGTAHKVTEAMAQLQFSRNEAAASIRRRGHASNVIGLLIEDLGNPFYSAIARAIEDAARARGVLLMVASSDEDPDRELELLGAFFSRRVEGLVLVPTATSHPELAAEVGSGTPVVFVDRPATVAGADSVVVDNRHGTQTGVQHLITQGHRRIGILIDGRATFTGEERLEGYRRALDAAGIAYDPGLVRTRAHDLAGAEECARELLTRPDPPTAMFAGNNQLAFGLLRAMHDLDHAVPVVGFDDFELASVLSPPVTVVAQDGPRLGAVAAELLFARLDGHTGPSRQIVLPTNLIVRSSEPSCEPKGVPHGQ